MMKNNRVRSGLITILSALMCVVIGLATGFLVLMVLMHRQLARKTAHT